MSPNFLSATWNAVAGSVGDHLWQSTLFAVAATLLTLVFRKNQARARYWLWLAASIKFLVPFSFLVAIGRHLAWWNIPAVTNTALYAVVEEIGQPFSQTTSVSAPVLTTSIPPSSLMHVLPQILAGIWLCGFLAVLVVWWLRWHRISATVWDSLPLRSGREVEALRRMERVTGIERRIEMLLSPSTLEPGIFGMSNPVLLWPEGISEHLGNAHLEAILAHELWHVRRRDNVAAAIHMVVEAVFWFYPLVWWLGTRLVDERERACDEEVVEFGGERAVYAESILKVCEFCLGSPLACVSGVTGADLKKRMVHIMSERTIRKLDLSRKVLLTAAALLAIAAPIVFGLVNATPTEAQSQSDSAEVTLPTIKAVSIKPSAESSPTPTYAGSDSHMVRMMFSPNGFVATNVALQAIIQEAYGVQANQIVGGPDWLNSERYDVQITLDNSEVNKSASGPEEMNKSAWGPEKVGTQKILQTVLADKTKLSLHSETKDLPTYALVIAENGPKLQPTQAPAGSVQGYGSGKLLSMRRMQMQTGEGQVVGLAAENVSVADFAKQLSRQLGTTVTDETGLKGSYDFTLHWSAPKAPSENGAGAPDDMSAPDSSHTSLLSAVQEQLGLKLKPRNKPLQVLVIDHIEKPAED
jgi:bla regulator protein blaR1